MKKNKWLKWKVGAAASLGIALLFHEVRASDSFQQAVADMSSADGKQLSSAAQQDQGPVMDDSTWQSFFQNGDTGSAGAADQNGGQISGQNRFSVPSDVSPGSAHTRTGRS
jgi:hypothetical protein